MKRRLALMVISLSLVHAVIGVVGLTPEAGAVYYNLGAMWHAPKITYIQTAPIYHASAATRGSVSFSSLPTVGNTVIFTTWLGLATGSASNSTYGTAAVTDNQGNVYTRAATTFSGVFAVAIYFAKVTSSSGTFTITVGGFPSSFLAVTASEYGGIDPTSPLDQTQVSSGTTSSRTTGTTAATVQSSELLIAASGDPSTGTITYSNTAGSIFGNDLLLILHIS